MPIYEYACHACGAGIEKLQRMSDDPLTDCPECGKPALVRKVSAAGFRLKGGGWYETDFKSSGKRNVVADKSDGGGKADGKQAAKNDAMPGTTGDGQANSQRNNKGDSKAGKSSDNSAAKSASKDAGNSASAS